MILADKLNQLRTRSGLSQEELAEKMHVSRQSVSKWESGASIPSMDKVVELSSIFGISTDYLLKDEIEEVPGEIVADLGDTEECHKISLEDAREYLSIVKENAKKIALGVGLCIASPVPMLFLLGFSQGKGNVFSEDIAGVLGAAVLLLIVGCAVALFILSRITMSRYDYLEQERIQLTYGVEGILEKEQEEYKPVFYKRIACAVLMLIVSAVPLIVCSLLKNDSLELYMVALLLFVIAVAVNMIVNVCCNNGAFDRLLQKGDYTVQKKKAGKKLSIFSSVYWTLAAALYLGISFLTNHWESTWIVWPVAGVLFAAVYAILEAYVSREK